MTEISKAYSNLIKEQQMAEWEAHEKAFLARGECPHTSERLTTHGEAGPNRLSCSMCDCFGYRPDEVGLRE